MTKSTRPTPAQTSPKWPEDDTKTATTTPDEEIASLKAQLAKKTSEYNKLQDGELTKVDLLTRKLNAEIAAHSRTERKLKERTSALFKAEDLNKKMQDVNSRRKAKTEKAVLGQKLELKRAQTMTRDFIKALDRGLDQKRRAERAEKMLEDGKYLSVFFVFVGAVCLVLTLWSYSKYQDLLDTLNVGSLL
ncbi:hypothetical protein IFR05_009133 [Cadophora sp. M221]|nr:hypothetical protein IFR05_009133 [Cadophora sp. M221]